ncbi:hypothetical protein QCA50_017762 [Cerrena zonata]|uniref:DUF6570 domain-containing protein n=1 Tax=Cerrena zonata TaxID=2478898 RepID=A0AAW0FI21_9APHY
MDTLKDDLAQLTIVEIRDLVRGMIPIPRPLMKKAAIIDHIATQAGSNTEWLETLEQTHHAFKEHKRELERQRSRRCGSTPEGIVPEEVMERPTHRLEEWESPDESKFLQLPTKEQIDNCHAQFCEATSNRSLETKICAVCAREIDGVTLGEVLTIALDELPNAHRLIPTRPHPSHTLYSRMSLEPTAVECREDGSTWLTICKSCHHDLSTRSNATLPPKYSLANNLWIGPIPWILSQLTIPEQLLIAHLYPRVFVFKLSPKSFTNPDTSMLQRAM